MPLYINETIRMKTEHLDSFESMFAEYSLLKDKSKQVFNVNNRKTFDCQKESVLYVLQGEFAIVSPNDDSIEVLLTDDTTTCITGILRHCQSGVTCLIHYDRTLEVEQFQQHLDYILEKMIQTSNQRKTNHNNHNSHAHKLNPYAISNSFDLYLIGGYCDERQISTELTTFILKQFINLKKFIVNLCCSFTGELNTEQTTVILNGNYGRHKQVSKPIVYGAAIEIKTGQIFNAVVDRKNRRNLENSDEEEEDDICLQPPPPKDRTIREPFLKFLPLYELRRVAVSYASCDASFTEIYDTENCVLKIEPMVANISAISPNYYKYYLGLSDEDLLFKFSTSPYVEPEHFVDDIRSVFHFIRRHRGKNIPKIYFPTGKARYFKLIKPKGNGNEVGDGNEETNDNSIQKQTNEENLFSWEEISL